MAGGGIAGVIVADRLTENPNDRYVHLLLRSFDAHIYHSHGTRLGV